MGHAEVARDVLLGRRALLFANDDDRPAIEIPNAANDRGIVAEAAVAAGRSVVARLASGCAAPRRVTETAKLSASTSIVTAAEPSASRMRSSNRPRT